MKQLFLTGIATLFLTAGTAHASVQLPETMLGDWCFNEAKEAYYIIDPIKKCDDTVLVVKPDGYETIEAFCTFDKIEQTARDTYAVHAQCKTATYEGGGDIEVSSWTENQEFQMTKDGLKITILDGGLTT